MKNETAGSIEHGRMLLTTPQFRLMRAETPRISMTRRASIGVSDDYDAEAECTDLADCSS